MKAGNALVVALFAAMGGSLVAGAAHAGPKGNAMTLMKRMDLNGDGIVTLEEAQQAKRQRLAAMDANGDGKVTADEIDAMIEKRMQRRKIRIRYRILGMMDANGDGVIDENEALMVQQQRFMKADLDGDGKLDRRELRLMQKRMARMMGGGHGRMMHGHKGSWRMHGKGDCDGMQKRSMKSMKGRAE